MAELAFMHVDQNIFIFSFLTQIQTDVFCCSGMLAKDTICAEMAFMLMERNRPGSTIFFSFLSHPSSDRCFLLQWHVGKGHHLC